ncbi:MAG: hypothetical protein JWM34_2311 [Ilumatobacteraceae bacterium]|nr:hypothetical protein [Ilumatobacteraceae bacterium]
MTAQAVAQPAADGLSEADLPSESVPDSADGRRTRDLALFVVKWWSVALFVLIGIVVTFDPPYSNSPAIRSDGLGYQAWTRAILDGNISFCPYTELTTVAALEPQTADGRCANKYPPGLAILRFPIMAPFTAINHGQLRSAAEDRVDQLLSLLAGATAMATVIATAGLLGIRRWRANFAAAAVMFGTNQFHFATYDSSFTHIYTAALVGLLIWLLVRHATSERPSMSTRASVAVGIIVGFIVDIRLMLIVPLAVAGAVVVIARTHKRQTPREFARDNRVVIIAAAVGALLAIVQNLAYNRYIFGTWRLSSYTGEDMIWSQGKQLDVLFSIRKGAIPWSPMIAAALVLTAFARRKVLLALAVGVTATLDFIYGSWNPWDLAGGFGHRGFVEASPIYALGVAAAIQHFAPSRRAIAYALSSACVLTCLGLMRGYWTGELGYYGASAHDYVRFAFGSDSFLVHYFRAFF